MEKRNVQIDNSGKIVFEEEFGYYTKALEFLTFSDPVFPMTELDLPHGANLEDIRFVFRDNDTDDDLELKIVRGYFSNGDYLYETVCELDSGDYPTTSNVREVTLSGSDILFPEVDNETYSYMLWAHI